MQPSVRKSIWAKMTAIGFIYLILLGNFWFSYRLFGQHSPEWLLEAFVVGIPPVIIGGLGVAFLSAKHYYDHHLSGQAPQENQDESDTPR